jgi:hypothetical protein
MSEDPRIMVSPICIFTLLSHRSFYTAGGPLLDVVPLESMDIASCVNLTNILLSGLRRPHARPVLLVG